MRYAYYRVIEEGISIPIDEEVGYYHHLKLGETICMEDTTVLYVIRDGVKLGINSSGVSFHSRTATKYGSTRWNIVQCVYYDNFIDVTGEFTLRKMRNEKLKELGI